MSNTKTLAGAIVIALLATWGCESQQPDVLGPDASEAPILKKGGNGKPGGGGGDGSAPPPAVVTVATPAGATANDIACTGERVGEAFSVACTNPIKYETVSGDCSVNGAQIQIGLIEVLARGADNDRVVIHGMDGDGVSYSSGQVDITPQQWDGTTADFTIAANVEAVMTKRKGKSNGVSCAVSLGTLTYDFTP